MKKYMFSLLVSFCSVFSLSAMSYEEAREQARFLTDKMAYELNLNDQQYNDCYEINLDYLLSVQTADDIYGDYLSYRNADIRHILYDWQYSLFVAADYFFHPLSWYRGAWFYPVYRHYSIGHFYYGLPSIYYSYRGGHGRFYHHAGFYASRRPHWKGGFRGTSRGPVNPHGGSAHHPGGVGHRPGGGSVHHPGGGHTGMSSHRPGYSIGGGNSRPDRNGMGGHHDGNNGGHNDNGHNNSGHSNFGQNNHNNNSGHHSYDRPSSTRSTVNMGHGNHSSHGGFSGSTHSGSSHSGSRGGFSGGSHGGSHGSSHGGGSRGGRGR